MTTDVLKAMISNHSTRLQQMWVFFNAGINKVWTNRVWSHVDEMIDQNDFFKTKKLGKVSH